MFYHHRRAARRTALLAGVAAAVLAFADLGLSPTRITLPIGSSGITVEAVRLEGGLVGAAFAQAGEITLENVRFNAGPMVYLIPELTVVGSSLSRDDLLAVLLGKTDEPWYEAIAALEADLITAPEVVLEESGIEGGGTGVYYDLRVETMREGRAERITIAGFEGETESPEGDTIVTTTGETIVEGLDLGQTVRWYSEAAPAQGDNPFVPIQTSMSISEIAVTDGQGVTIEIASITGGEASMRLMARPFNEIAPDLAALAEVEEPDPQQTAQIFGMLADMLGSFRLGPVAIEGIALTDAELGPDPAFGIERIDFGGDQGFSLTNFYVSVEEGDIGIEQIAASGYSFEPMIEGMRRLAEAPGADLDVETLRAMIPTIGTWTMTGLTADVLPEGEEEPVAFSLAGLEMSATEPVNGAPTNVAFRFDNLAFAIPEASEEDAAVQLRALGYADLDVSGSVAARWVEADREVVFDEITMTGVDMGGLTVSGAFGNIGPEAFGGDETAMMMAWLGATLKSFTVIVEDAGLAERVLAAQAEEQGVAPEDLRGQAVMMARGMLPAILGGTDQARALGDAIAAFLEAPGVLEIGVTANEADGIPLMALSQTENPMELLPLVTIDAQAR